MKKKKSEPGNGYKIKKSKGFISMFLGGKAGKNNTPAQSDSLAINNLLALLRPNENKQLKEDALRELKSEAGKELLLKAIAVSKDVNDTRILVAACWEAGLDFTKFVSFFVQLAIISEIDICLDALTIIEDMQGPFENRSLLDCIKKLEEARTNSKEQKAALLSEIITNLERNLTN